MATSLFQGFFMTLIPYDDRDGQIWLEDRLIPWRDAKIHFLTHALHYGSSVFEGIRCYGGKIFKNREHAQRLIDGCKVMDMHLPYSVEQVMQACEEVVRANNVGDGYLRPLAWRGAEQMGVAAQHTRIHFAVAAWEWPSYFPAEMREKGIRIVTSRWVRPSPQNGPVTVKAAGLYMICTLAKHESEAAGYHDALMHDYRGRVAELTGANFFMVKDGVLHTPEADCFLNGITRQTVINLARQEGIEVRERAIMPDEIAGAEECFATGTAAEITAIGQIDGKDYTVGPVTRRLRDLYEQLVRA